MLEKGPDTLQLCENYWFVWKMANGRLLFFVSVTGNKNQHCNQVIIIDWDSPLTHRIIPQIWPILTHWIIKILWLYSQCIFSNSFVLVFYISTASWLLMLVELTNSITSVSIEFVHLIHIELLMLYLWGQTSAYRLPISKLDLSSFAIWYVYKLPSI